MRIDARDPAAAPWHKVYLDGVLVDVEAADTEGGWADVVDVGPSGETRRMWGRVEIVHRETGEVWR